MCRRIVFLTIVLPIICISNLLIGQAKERKPLKELRLLYVGSERQLDFQEFLQEHVTTFDTATREDFQPKQASNYDVVLLDWPQGEATREMRTHRSPLGSREDWSRPTVLLGSAGLNLAVSWNIQGGSGCTCMDPLAYGFREHEIFSSPFKIELDAIIRIATPEAFKDEIKDDEVSVLPLVDNHQKKWRPGWCTYSNYFDKNPDVEMFCGGVNQKTPTAAGIWRQGNLLHFGFEQSPREMNEHGQKLLLNSIAYIARFSVDRPLATTPSIFGGPISRPRLTPARWLSNPDYPSDWVLKMFEPESRATLEQIESKSLQSEWCEQHCDYFYPKEDLLLGIDEDLQSLGVAFDVPKFFECVLADLDSKDLQASNRSKRLLARYVPCGPATDYSATEWRDWYEQNKPFLFALDTGDYRWYIDDLAKRRAVPTSELRGPLRADEP